MTMIPFSDARSGLTHVVNEVAYAGKRIVLTRKGKMLAAIVSLKDLESLQILDSQLRSSSKTNRKKTANRRIRKIKS